MCSSVARTLLCCKVLETMNNSLFRSRPHFHDKGKIQVYATCMPWTYATMISIWGENLSTTGYQINTWRKDTLTLYSYVISDM